MPYDDKTIEDSERDRWQDKKVDRRDAVGMVAQSPSQNFSKDYKAFAA